MLSPSSTRLKPFGISYDMYNMPLFPPVSSKKSTVVGLSETI